MSETATGKTRWNVLAKWSPTIFLVAGILLLGYAVSKGIYTFTNVTPFGAFDVAYGTLGLLVTVFGLLGIYPQLNDHAPRSSLAGVVFTAVATVCSIALLGWLGGATLMTEGYPAIPADAPGWTVAALLLVFVTLALEFLLFVVANLRTGVLPQTISHLLLVPGFVWIGLIVANVIAPSGQYLGLLAYVPISLALLAIGYLLWTEPEPTDRVEPVPTEARHD